MLILLIILLLVFIISLVLYFNYTTDYEIIMRDYNLHDDGITLIYDAFSDEQINSLLEDCKNNNYIDVQQAIQNNKNLLHKIHNVVGNNYEFQDYVWIIKQSSIHTCHRDNNGDFFNHGQQHPSYTMLIYLEDMPSALGFIPKSHIVENKYNNSFNLTNPLNHVSCKRGTAIIFNANLIHVGTIDDAVEDHIRVQMKITHHDDRYYINYYENFHKVLNTTNTIPKWVRKIQKNVSCMMPIISDVKTNTNVSYIKGTHNGYKIGVTEQIFSSLYYGDSKFYDLPNAY